jgi:hypothetical protein
MSQIDLDTLKRPPYVWDMENHQMKQAIGYVRGPLGFRRAGDRLEENADELATVKTIREFRGAGRSLAQIAAELTRRGIPTKRGRAWHASTVRCVLENALYAAVA